VQIRFGACKGVIALNPQLTQKKMRFRPSMLKFQIPNPTDSQRTIEVIRYSKPSRGYLNRQFILLFHSLGVPQEYFLELQNQTVREIHSLKRTKACAEQMLKADESEDSLHGKAVKMLLAGIDINEPYLQSLLQSIQRSMMHSIVSKAKILVPKSRNLLGVCDQSFKLEPGQCFVQLSDGKTTNVLLGKVAVTRNPCVHPGDIRVLEAVNVPELHHLVDVIVFPVKGLRPHPDEIAGGDLDGDQYFVTYCNSFSLFSSLFCFMAHCCCF
jgi:RNA-dependent RNA polymerase